MTLSPKKIILISLDTLRADHLGCYGYYRNTSPIIDELARDNILFNYAFTTCSFTLPAHASLFTSKYKLCTCLILLTKGNGLSRNAQAAINY